MNGNSATFRYSGTRFNFLYTHGFYKNTHFSRHSHEEISMGYAVKGGQKSFRLKGAVELPSDDMSIMVLNHDEIHDGSPLIDSSWEYEGIYIPIKCFTEYNYNATGLSHIPLFSKPIIIDTYLLTVLKTVISKALSDKSNLFEIENYESLILSHLIENHCLFINHKKIKNPNLNIVKEIIQDDPLADYNIELLSSISNFNPSYLVRAFKSQYGISPYAYLLQKRLEISKKMLAKGISISEVASICKFYDQSHFNKYFKKMYGITPGLFQTKSNKKS